MRRKIYKEDIIKVGMELMLLNGYVGTGIKDITDKMEIPKGSFYNHFKNKEEFGLEVLNFYMTEALENLNSLFSNKELNSIEKMKMFFDVIIDNQNNVAKYKYGCLLGNFSQELADVNEVMRKAIKNSFHKMRKSFSACIQEGQDNGEIVREYDAELLADFLINGWEGAYLRMKAEKSAEPIEQFRDILINNVLT